MYKQHIKQPLVIISPIFKKSTIEKKLSMRHLSYKQRKQNYFEKNIFSIKYKEKIRQKQLLAIRKKQFLSSPKTEKSEFQSKLLDVLKKQNSAILTHNLVNISLMNGSQSYKVQKNLNKSTAINSCRNQLNERENFLSNTLELDFQTKEKNYFRRSCEAKDLKESLEWFKNNDDDNDKIKLKSVNKPCLIASLKLKIRPTTSKLTKKDIFQTCHKLRQTSRKSSGYNNFLKNNIKQAKKQEFLQPWFSADPLQQW